MARTTGGRSGGSCGRTPWICAHCLHAVRTRGPCCSSLGSVRGAVAGRSLCFGLSRPWPLTYASLCSWWTLETVNSTCWAWSLSTGRHSYFGFSHSQHSFLAYPPLATDTATAVGGEALLVDETGLALGRFTHGYDNYITHAFPHDELKPLSLSHSDSLGAHAGHLLNQRLLLSCCDDTRMDHNHVMLRAIAGLARTCGKDCTSHMRDRGCQGANTRKKRNAINASAC